MVAAAFLVAPGIQAGIDTAAAQRLATLNRQFGYVFKAVKTAG
jgi:hypothetical protein